MNLITQDRTKVSQSECVTELLAVRTRQPHIVPLSSSCFQNNLELLYRVTSRIRVQTTGYVGHRRQQQQKIDRKPSSESRLLE